MSKVKILIIMVLVSCGLPKANHKAQDDEFQLVPRQKNVLDFIHENGIKTAGRKLNVYFFSGNTCVSCNKEKLESLVRFFKATNIPTIIVLDSEEMLKQSLTNKFVTVIKEDSNVLSKKGLRFASPCVYAYDNDRFLNNHDLDTDFIENADIFFF